MYVFEIIDEGQVIGQGAGQDVGAVLGQIKALFGRHQGEIIYQEWSARQITTEAFSAQLLALLEVTAEQAMQEFIDMGFEIKLTSN